MAFLGTTNDELQLGITLVVFSFTQFLRVAYDYQIGPVHRIARSAPCVLGSPILNLGERISYTVR